MLIRVPDSAKPMQDDLVRAAAAGQPLELSDQGAETLCRILLDMPDIGMWRKTAMQILPFYRDMAQLLLAVDVRGFPGERRDRAGWMLAGEQRTSAPSSSFSVALTGRCRLLRQLLHQDQPPRRNTSAGPIVPAHAEVATPTGRSQPPCTVLAIRSRRTQSTYSRGCRG